MHDIAARRMPYIAAAPGTAATIANVATSPACGLLCDGPGRSSVTHTSTTLTTTMAVTGQATLHTGTVPTPSSTSCSSSHWLSPYAKTTPADVVATSANAAQIRNQGAVRW